MKKTIELVLKITVDNDQVLVEVDQLEKPLSVMPPYDGPLSVSVNLSADTNTYTTTTWHGSEEMWYSSYKE